MSKQNNVATPKTISADTKKNLVLDIKFNTFEELRQLVGAREEATPGEVFQYLLEDKKKCPRSMLKEMLGLSDKYLRALIYEGHRIWDRGILTTGDAIWVLTRDHELDQKTMEATPIHFTSAQEKLRSLLVKHIRLLRFVALAGAVEEEYDYSILYDLYDEIEADNHISENDVLDALHTYQAEHQS